MALIKNIKNADGVTVAYHRILYMQIVTNSHVSVVVQSYVDAESRAAEKNNLMPQPYAEIETFEFEYDENLNVKKAYKLLRKIAKYADAQDDEELTGAAE